MTGSTTTSPSDASNAGESAARVGFIGLGSQGGPMARKIAESDFATVLWARRPESLDAYADVPVRTAATPAALGRECDLVCVCVVDDAGVVDIVTGEQGLLAGMQPGGAIAIHSTIRPETCTALAEKAQAVGVSLIDAPVSGGGSAAAQGNLLVMVGGDDDTVARFRPVFDTFADPVVHLGPLGSGQVTKLLNNTLFTANLATAASVLEAGRSLGVDPVRLSDVIAEGSGASFAMRILGSKGGDLAAMSDTAGPLLRKDVGILGEVLSGEPASRGAVWDAADSALATMRHPRA